MILVISTRVYILILVISTHVYILILVISTHVHILILVISTHVHILILVISTHVYILILVISTHVHILIAVGVFESMKGILHDGNVDVRVQYMIEVMFAIRKDGFKEHPSIVEGLDLVEEEDQITHLLSLEDEIEGEERLSMFIYLVICYYSFSLSLSLSLSPSLSPSLLLRCVPS